MFSNNTKPPNHRLKVTAGTSYNSTTHQTITVNSASPLHLQSSDLSTNLWVRIKDYTGTTSPPTSPYFTHPPFNTNLYSLTLTFTPTHSIPGNDLLFGNDFDHPIRSYLPPGFNTALKIVKSTLDPSLEGDAYAEKPYLYSPGLAAWNQFSLREKGDREGNEDEDEDEDVIVYEGGVGTGLDVRKGYGIPDDAGSRRRFFLDEERRKEFVFEEGRMYAVEFGNGFLDFNEFAIRIPGISFHIGKYVSEKNNVLRYVLKDRGTGEVYLVVCFTVVLEGEDAEDAEEGEEGRDEGDGVD
ncbi:hypothetical protein ASPCADRAFT_131719 [Aspergillus carbonarius ITEM 5010]|uniref:Domain of unknown function at the cortex 1 domain-containing protein n=1 Tax=Aspergillus carbonarius (strain ITEM 5010) TaxID=602072 RepID=A0A1R3RI44_ASPC5|nr:hypothetical protein ASPCADRAFT_131652 [Aspergillus carbonarius ITEM 5010]OOF94157.1 hypothetical protein ASPCADRAFT_131719 [Aspergillus carbonarius ITEM 5010]